MFVQSKKLTIVAIAVVGALLGTTTLADTVTLKNGDKLTGTVVGVTGGTLTFKGALVGEVKINTSDIESFVTDAPLPTQLKTGRVGQPVTGGNSTSVTTAGGTTVPLSDVKAVNPPAQKWTGSVVANLSVARGNTDTLDAGLAADASLRRDDGVKNDRLGFEAEYNYSRNGSGEDSVVSADNWLARGQYDNFWSEKLYGYANFKYEHDRIAELNYRLAPGVGLGYQWFETPKMNFTTEAGITYVYQEYESSGTEEAISGRLAYHYTNKFTDTVSMFHNLEYVPSFEDPGDYLLTTDIGLRANLTKAMFTQASVELKRDSTPSEGSEKNDLKFVIGIGWQF